MEELAAAINISWAANSNAQVDPPINIITNIPASWAIPAATEFSNLKKSGDYLYLPAAETRYTNGSRTNNIGRVGSYWGSKAYNVSLGFYIHLDEHYANLYASSTDRAYGMSVRCVEE
jgi:hypothetical protein